MARHRLTGESGLMYKESDLVRIAKRENNKKLISKNIIFYKGKNKQKKQEIENERKVRMYEY